MGRTSRPPEPKRPLTARQADPAECRIVPWVETHSPSFTARHDASEAVGTREVLDQLEDFRAALEPRFDRTPGEVTVIVHSQYLQLAVAHPWMPLARMISAPAARRYFGGWFARDEIHVLAPDLLRRRASEVPGSREALERAPLHEYAHLVVGANNAQLPPPFTPGTFRRYVRWAWLSEGAATWLSGQERHLGAAVARRLREGGRPVLPPAARDATLLGGAVFGMLEAIRGAAACVELACRPLDPEGGEAALERAFAMPISTLSREWRGWLDELHARSWTARADTA